MADVAYTIKIEKTKNTAEMSGNELAQEKASKDQKADSSVAAKVAIGQALFQSGKQAMQAGLNIYTQLTGSTKLSEALGMATTISSDVAIIASTGWAGVITVGTKVALSAANTLFQNNLANRQIAYNNQTLGEISRAGSRYY